MAYRWETMSRIAREKVVAIIRAADADEAFELGRQALTAGLGVVEIALTTPGALGVIEQLARERPDASIGAGTVLDAAEASAAAAAGARVLVCPTFAPTVVRAGHRHGAAVIAGCSTATEMQAALEVGADAVKLFPAETWEPRSLESLLQALPQLPCVPTGGVSLDSARAWIAAGAIAVGIGSALTAGGADLVQDRVRALVSALAQDVTGRG